MLDDIKRRQEEYQKEKDRGKTPPLGGKLEPSTPRNVFEDKPKAAGLGRNENAGLMRQPSAPVFMQQHIDKVI
jgi:hypothetical protein